MSHENQFRGWWIPADVVAMFEAGQINATELILLAAIDGLVKSGRNGAGCYATNSYLGEKIGSTAKHVSRLISHLTDLKLIRDVSKGTGRRSLETKGSRISRR